MACFVMAAVIFASRCRDFSAVYEETLTNYRLAY